PRFLPLLILLGVVADLDVGVVGERHAALIPLTHFGDIVLLPPQRGDRALGDNDTFPQQSRLGIAANRTVDDHTAGDDARLGRAEDLPDLRLAERDLLVYRLQHALQCGF